MRNKPKVVLDTNIFIKGWFFPEENDYCVDTLKLLAQKKIYLLCSQDMIGELVYVTKNFARHNIDDVNSRILILQHIMKIFYFSNSINTEFTKSPEINDEHDIMFLQCAIAGEADYLVSDDFKSGMHGIEDFGFRVVGAKDFCELMEVDDCVSVG